MDANGQSFDRATPEVELAIDSGFAPASLPGRDSRTTAEVLKELRREFPDMSLAERVAALTGLLRL